VSCLLGTKKAGPAVQEPRMALGKQGQVVTMALGLFILLLMGSVYSLSCVEVSLEHLKQ
jgi:hypothetical protein